MFLLDSRRLFATGLLLSTGCLFSPALAGPNDSDWVQLFNGKDLNDWDIKFAKHDLNENFNNTVKVADSVMSIDYSGWGSFGGEYGHIGYKVRAFSHYLLRVEYQVGDKQVNGGESWAVQNNGLMLHSQAVSTMTKNQDFPISMEMQLLGAGNTASNGTYTLNLCTPGTAFYKTLTGGSVTTDHCVSASGNANNRPSPGQWAWVSASVMGDSIIRHYNQKSPTGTPVFTYYRPVYWAGNVSNGPANTPANGTKLDSGYITVQAESHPYKFRKIELLNLKGCTTVGNEKYKSYFVKSDPSACSAAVGLLASQARAGKFFRVDGNRLSIFSPGDYEVELLDLAGKTRQKWSGQDEGARDLRVGSPGIYWVKLKNSAGTFSRPVALF